MTDAPSANPIAIASLVVGIVSVTCVCFCYGFPFNLIAIVLGAVALWQASTNPTMGGRGLAYAGLGLGLTSVLLGVLVFIFALGTNLLVLITEGANY